MSNPYHIPVLLHDCIDALAIKPDGIYVDVTFGGGGHSKEILKKLGEKGKLIAFDQDADALLNVFEDDRFELIHQFPDGRFFFRACLEIFGNVATGDDQAMAIAHRVRVIVRERQFVLDDFFRVVAKRTVGG